MTTLWDSVNYSRLRTDLDVLQKNFGKPRSSVEDINRLIGLSALFDVVYPPGSIVHVGLLETKFPYEIKSGSYVLLDTSNIGVLVKDKHFSSREDMEISVFDMEEFSELWKIYTQSEANK